MNGKDGIGALVLGGDYRGLGIVRSLGRRGIPVWVISGDHRMADYSRYTRKKISWKHIDPGQRAQFLLDLAEEHYLDGWVVFPTSDEAAALVARNHEMLSQRFRLTTPHWKKLSWFHDKRLTYHLAARTGVYHPWTCYPKNREEVACLSCDFPVILKPAIREIENPLTHDKAWQVNTLQELLNRYDEACRLMPAELIMIQELIPGDGDTQYSFAALCENGVPLFSLVAKRKRQYPMDFGRFSTFVETVDQAEVEEQSRCILTEINYTGLVELEYKYDARCSHYKLLDINPRVWGWHTLGKRLGMDFPYLNWQSVNGERLPAMQSKPGVKWIRWLTDVYVGLQEVKNKKISLGSYLGSLKPPIEEATFALDDLMPALAEIPMMFAMVLARRNV